LPEKAVEKAFLKSDIILSTALLEEYRSVPIALESKRKITHLQLKALITGIAAFVANARVVLPSKKFSLCRDDKDNMLLECCFAGKADILLSGDKDLLEIDNLPFTLNILTPREYLNCK